MCPCSHSLMGCPLRPPSRLLQSWSHTCFSVQQGEHSWPGSRGLHALPGDDRRCSSVYILTKIDRDYSAAESDGPLNPEGNSNFPKFDAADHPLSFPVFAMLFAPHASPPTHLNLAIPQRLLCLYACFHIALPKGSWLPLLTPLSPPFHDLTPRLPGLSSCQGPSSAFLQQRSLPDSLPVHVVDRTRPQGNS